MSVYQDRAQEIIRDWFNKAALWQKDVFVRLWNGADDYDEIFQRSIKLIEQEYLSIMHRISADVLFPSNITFSNADSTPILLKKISDVKGVGALEPRNSLEFGNGLTIVYGENGCGKSSYVKVLRAAENPQKANLVIGNVFREDLIAAQATLTFSFDGTHSNINWSKNLNDTCPIQVYDTSVAKQFVEKENEILYEPKLLALITRMAEIYTHLSDHFRAKHDEINRKFVVPEGIVGAQLIQEFEKLATLKAIGDFQKKINWNDTLSTELAAISESLKEADPTKAAIALTAQRTVIEKHQKIIQELFSQFDDGFCKSYLSKRQRQIATKRLADEFIVSSTSKSNLPGLGTELWRNMWLAAREYVAAQESDNGSISINNLCVLCQQELDKTSIERIAAFRSFIESQTIEEAHLAHSVFEEIVQTVQQRLTKDINIGNITMELLSNSIPQDAQELIIKSYAVLHDRCKWLLDYEDSTETILPAIVEVSDMSKELEKQIDSINLKIKKLQEIGEDKDGQLLREIELKSMQWIVSNMSYKIEMLNLSTVITKCKTNALTTLKKDLADILITNIYIARFQEEMCQLDPSQRIKVELVSKGAKQGRTYHQVSLKEAVGAGNKRATAEILSEGEYRVVSLAAFLADLSSWGKVMPFIFDDPITSLDHKFEERVATRLVSLSTERQVIVFTHRLAFAQLLDECCTRYNADTPTCCAQIAQVELRNSPLGEPIEPTYIYGTKMVNAFNKMKNDDISKIRRFQSVGDYPTADSCMQALCSRIRNVIEQGIEHELLSGIVSRFGRNISSLKLPRLFAMTNGDISLFIEMMTKYSYFDHSQSIEQPTTLPQLQDVEIDICKMIDWCKDYRMRCEVAAKQSKGKS